MLLVLKKIQYKVEDNFLKIFQSIAKEKGINVTSLAEASRLAYGSEHGYVLKFQNGISDIIPAIEEAFDFELEYVDLSLVRSTTERVRILLNSRIYGSGNRKRLYESLRQFYSSRAGYSVFIKSAWKTVDNIWYFAGDKSLDWNYYSKRAILFAVYCSSIKYYACSNSDSSDELNKKINKNLARVGVFNKFKQKLSPSNIPFIRLLRNKEKI